MFELRRGMKKLWVAVFFLSVLMVSGAILETMKYARDVHAQTELTTEDVRVKYFEWADTAEWFLGYGYAVTESGELYYSTDILKAPFKRVYFANGEPLKNIKKVSTQNYLNMRGSGNIFVFALTEDGTIYVKGSNVNNVFADTNISSSSTFIPLSYEFNSPVKDVKVGARNAYVLLENGEVYASGSAVGGGLGNADSEIGTGFTKVAVERIKQIEANHYNAYALDEDGAVWAWGHIPYGRNDNVWDSNTPTKMKNSDGTDFDIPVKFLGNASMSQEIMGGIDGIGLVFMGEDKKIYYVQNRGTSGINVGPVTYTPKEIVAEYPELTGNITNLTYGMHNLSLVDNQTYYIMYSSGLAGENKFDQTSNARDAVNKVIPYQSTAAGVDASVPVLSAAETYGHTYIIKSEDKKLYIKGMPAKYVLDLEIKAKKATDNTEYRSEEKYNRDIQFSFQVAQQDQNSIRYKIADLPDGTFGEEHIVSDSNNFPISVAEGEHIHRTYRAYIAGNEASYTTSYTVDLYKKSFADVSISNNGTYAINKEITFDATNGLEGNQVAATLTNAEGTSTTISSGHSITEEGSYHLTLKDSYGNQYDADFVIAPAAQGITFTPSETLVYGNNVTTAGARMGTLSLVYGEGLPQLSIAEASITGGDEQGYFTIDMDTTSNTTYIKAAQDVPAGEYNLTIAGKDEEGVDFEYSVTFVVAKANVTLL